MRKAVFYGVLGMAALLGVYFAVMGLASGSWSYTVRQLIDFKYWISALILGFGIQVGLFTYLNNCHGAGGTSKKAAVAGAGTASGAMLACCAHHLSDILPFLGLSGISLLMAKYQTWFLSLGIAANSAGIFLMLKQIKKLKKNE